MMYSYSGERAGTSSNNNKVVPMKRKVAATNVLIIDDDRFFRDSLSEFLSDDGTVNIVHRCGSYKEAKAWCSQESNMKGVDAIILDVMLPYETNAEQDGKPVGLIILEKLRNQVGFTGPIVMLTSSVETEFGQDALAKGCSAYVCKHASADSIPKMVAELKLALSGEVLLVPSKLRHLIVSNQRNKPQPGSVVMETLSQQPAWLTVKEELKFEVPAEEQCVSSARMQRRMGEWDIQQRRESTLTGAPAALVSQVMENTPKPIFITTADGAIVFTNRASELMFGCDRSEFVGMNLQTVIPGMRNDRLTGGAEIECNVRGANGAKLTVSVATSAFEEGGNAFFIHIFTDLTNQKSTEQRLKALVSELEQSSTRLEELVKTDPLTGLLNRRGLENVLSRELSLARRNQSDVIALVIDLDDFKSINDGYGHAAGDLVLKSVARVLKDTLRTSDWLGRVGGDEFMIFLPDTSLQNAAQIAERIRANVFKTPILKDGVYLKASTSLGVAELPHDIATLEEVLELTKSGLKSSKRRGKNTVSISAYKRPTSQVDTMHEHRLVADSWLHSCVRSFKKLCTRIGAK